MSTRSDAARMMKRRGILAAAGAAVAGIVAKQASRPARATSGTGPDGNLVIGSNSSNNTANYATLRTELVSGLNFHGPVLLDCNVSPFQSSGDADAIGVSGISRGTAAGAYGSDSVGSKPSGYPSGMYAGVYGYTSMQGHSGVRGDGGSYGIGVSGVSTNANAVLGTTLGSPFNANPAVLGLGNGVGVEGNVPSSSLANTIAVFGNNLATGANSVAVYGSCATGTGIYGQTAASYQYGILGATYATNSTAIAGACTGDGSSAFSGGTTNPNAFAGFFQGTTVVQGNFAVTGNKSAALAHPDGSHRLVYCVESPESWIEDVGIGTLISGTATVIFDKDFTAVVHTDAYHVFLTEYGESNGLYVSSRNASGFTVQERNKGKTSGTFSWRVMVKRSDVKAERLGKFTMPNISLPDVSKYKAPVAPVVTPPHP